MAIWRAASLGEGGCGSAVWFMVVFLLTGSGMGQVDGDGCEVAALWVVRSAGAVGQVGNLVPV